MDEKRDTRNREQAVEDEAGDGALGTDGKNAGNEAGKANRKLEDAFNKRDADTVPGETPIGGPPD